ncbi:hypothetical protein [Planktothrix mougeotii]|uniref:Uncharacterized protein n=1 Tax=Planktothrix mougeotii LEGE 06226 TaxID=1828728 RepID=A0ABR9UEL6_9CYAN|nr:hypothetical protein [Planktothrix mougeotii]MBE9144897.1 hypothetical protein [Planktothrix mougeotii LEGE 06226]
MNRFEQNCLESEELAEDFIINNIELIDVGEPEFCKFERAIKFDGTTPIEWIEVYGFKLGNWGLVPSENDWQLYHIREGKFMTLLPFTLANGLKGLKILVALFGEEFTTPPMGTKPYAKAYRRAYKFEKYCAAELIDRSYLFDDDDDDSNDYEDD